MERKHKRFGMTDWCLLIVSVLFLVGIRTAFAPCKPTEDGSWMTCHWAGQAVTGVAAVLLVLAILHLLLPGPGEKLGVAAAMIPVSLLAAFLPGKLINLCMMGTMRCHGVTRPAVLVFSLMLAVLSLADLLLQRKKVSQ